MSKTYWNRPRKGNTSWACGKIRYSSAGEAYNRADAHSRMDNEDAKPYYCSGCGGWHLTTHHNPSGGRRYRKERES